MEIISYNLALKIPHAVTYGAGSLCRGDVLGAFFMDGLAASVKPVSYGHRRAFRASIRPQDGRY